MMKINKAMRDEGLRKEQKKKMIKKFVLYLFKISVKHAGKDYLWKKQTPTIKMQWIKVAQAILLDRKNVIKRINSIVNMAKEVKNV